jgi:hypothetical protein
MRREHHKLTLASLPVSPARALGYGRRFVAKRIPGLTRRDVRRHNETCLPGKLEEVNEDLRRLGRGK